VSVSFVFSFFVYHSFVSRVALSNLDLLKVRLQDGGKENLQSRKKIVFEHEMILFVLTFLGFNRTEYQT
jgi:hypothetical protein